MAKFLDKKITFSPLIIASIYAVLAAIWIFFTDSFIESLNLSEHVYSFLQTIKGLLFVSATSLLIFIMTNRSLKTQNHFISVLSVLSDINQLIVREKDMSKLLQKSCDILASSHIYNHAWIMTLDEDKQLNDLIYSGTLKKAHSFKEKIKNNWTPTCISKVAKTNGLYSFVKDTLKECNDCPLADSNDFKSAFTIELKHEDKLYGYLNISVHKEYLNDKKELALLKELAGDISYALNNLKLEKILKESNAREKENENNMLELKELYENIISSVDNLIFVKDINFNYMTCSSAFEKFMGRSKEELIGKNDYDFFEKEIADSFRKHDKKMFMENKTKSEYMWVTYPDGSKVYLLTTISPLINSDKKTFGFVGNSVDITKQQHTLERLKEAQAFAKLGSWEYNIEKDELVATEELYNIYGVKDLDTKLTKQLFYKHVHTDDIKTTKRDFKKSVHVAQGNIFHNRIIRKNDGETRYLEHRWSTKYKDGIAVMFSGTTQDITDIKLAELELIISNDKFEKAFDNTPNIIILSNLQTGKIYDINRTFTNIFGYEKDEVIGKTTFDIDLWHDFNDRQKYVDSFKKFGYIQGQIYTFNTKNKNTITAKVHASLVTIDNKEYILAVAEDIRESIKIQAALKESEKKFRLLIEQSPFVIEIYDIDGLQTTVNHAYETLWEFPAETTLNKFNVLKSQEVKETGLLKYVKRAYDGEYVNVPIYEFNPTGKTESQGKGRVRCLSTKIFPLKDKNSIIKNIVIMHEDVTEQEETRKLLEEKKKELETVIQEAPNPIMVHNEDGEVLLVNKVWEQLTGYKHEEINTITKWTKKAYGKEMSTVKENIDKLYDINTKVDEGEYNILTKNKETIIWQFSSASLGIINSKRTIISSAMDITELKHKDELIMIQSRHAAMGEMIGMIAHQWRQPISVIAMAANNLLLDIALDRFDSTEAEKFSHGILKQTSHLSKTIDDFRNFFRPDKDVSKVKLQYIIEETLIIIKNSLINNSIEIQTSFESESEVDAYPRELIQVFINIINNAKDAMLLDSVTKPIIKIKVYEDNKYVNTEVCDNAKGIDAAVLPKIFDPYFTTKDEKTGTGLGLYMSKMIIENHLKGIIEAYNTKEGACFRVRLLK